MVDSKEKYKFDLGFKGLMNDNRWLFVFRRDSRQMNELFGTPWQSSSEER